MRMWKHASSNKNNKGNSTLRKKCWRKFVAMWQTLNYAMIAEHLNAHVLLICVRVFVCVCVYVDM